ncbi:transaldolase family protein [Lacipirellula sp.]|uniref:transaldolase family protein n=1 Tax=Lacipirellula sp. TaxID=2691419 RepID=UPI003D0C4A8C
MPSPIESIIAAGTKIWLDSVDPDLVRANRALGASGATSNPIIISDLVKTGKFDDQLAKLLKDGLPVSDAAWTLTDQVVAAAQEVFRPVWDDTKGDDGYVSFELDPLLEDAECKLSIEERSARYIELGTKWSKDRPNRMIKVPATPAGLGALEELCARGISLNVTLVFSMRQYEAARDAVWRGAQRRKSLDAFKSVYSIFISRLDVYTEKYVPSLSEASQGQVGIVNAKQIWRANQEFWASKGTPLKQEIVFASTGTKRASDPPWKYVEALVGSDIQTNPPATNDAVQSSGKAFRRTIDELPPPEVLGEIAAKVDAVHLEQTLMEEGLRKFADPQKGLLALLETKLGSLG